MSDRTESPAATALRRLVEVAQDFLRHEYPTGTTHPADAEAARLERAVNEASEVLDANT